ncbi:GyrI-like domain-containing protein, partial [Chloroflexota bacterium]
ITRSVLVEKTVPPLKYARFIHKGPDQDRHLTLDYIYHTWLPKSGHSLSPPLAIEYYGQDFRSADNEVSEREIYVPLK